MACEESSVEPSAAGAEAEAGAGSDVQTVVVADTSSECNGYTEPNKEHDDNSFEEFVSADDVVAADDEQTKTPPRQPRTATASAAANQATSESNTSSSSLLRSPKLVRIQPPPGSTPLLKFDSF